MQIKLILAKTENKEIFTSLYREYRAELMALLPESKRSAASESEASDLLQKHCSKPDHYPYLMVYDDEVIGFSFIRSYPFEKEILDIEQFFVTKAYRKAGAGKESLGLTLSQHPGRWLIRVMCENREGLAFWSKSIAELTEGSCKRTMENHRESLMHFFRFES